MSLLIPGAGFIKAIMAIKDLIVFFVESAIMLIPAITEAILALAAGSVAGVAKAIEFGLSKLIALVINLFAKLIGLGGLSKKVMAIFTKIRKRVDKAVMKLLNKAKKAGRKLLGKLGIGGKDKGDKAKHGGFEIGKVVHFKDKSENHKLWVEEKGNSLEIMVASHDPSPVIRRLVSWDKIKKSKAATEQQKSADIESAKQLYNELMKEAKSVQTKKNEGEKSNDDAKLKEAKQADKNVESKEDRLASMMKTLFTIYGDENTLDAATIAEAQGKFQSITDTASSEVAAQWNNPLPPYLTIEERYAANTKYLKENAHWLWMANYGKSVERFTKNRLIKGTEFQAVGGASNPDFIGKSQSKYREGCGIRSTARILNISPKTDYDRQAEYLQTVDSSNDL